MDSVSPVRALDASNTVAGVKRSAPSLLPAFEPIPSPRFKRQKSRPSPVEAENRYPTPTPSSSLGHSPSPALQIPRRPLLARTQSTSTLSERAPLGALPSITLSDDGEPIFLGRSSNSSHYQLSANRLISRVHVKAVYLICPDSLRPRIEINCMGWNGVKIHCQSQAWELAKGDVFMSETEHADIMLDVQDSRVVLAWPPGNFNNSSGGSPPGSPVGRVERSPSICWLNEDAFDGKVVKRCGSTCTSKDKYSRFRNSTSPSPRRVGAGNASFLPSESMMTTDTLLEIYEDEPVEDYDESSPDPVPEKDGISIAAEKLILGGQELEEGASSDEEEEEEEEDDSQEDPVAQSFAQSFAVEEEQSLPPMAKFSTTDALRTPPRSSTRLPRASLMSPVKQRRSDQISPSKTITVQNHIANQLAFSRLQSAPLSALFSNLPATLSASLTKERLAVVLESIECIGEVKRQGKDAAGKPLESEYYYIPDGDGDASRRAAVVGAGRAGLRACRKTHKQYYWKKPKKPAY